MSGVYKVGGGGGQSEEISKELRRSQEGTQRLNKTTFQEALKKKDAAKDADKSGKSEKGDKAEKKDEKKTDKKDKRDALDELLGRELHEKVEGKGGKHHHHKGEGNGDGEGKGRVGELSAEGEEKAG